MTHDELLAKMDKEVEMAEFESACGDGNDPRIAKALRAVVELHKSYPYTNYRGQQLHFCNHCMDDEINNTDYPCPTIQAIEKELM
jgi:hypothetical protein